jgi:hypothetical protein
LRRITTPRTNSSYAARSASAVTPRLQRLIDLILQITMRGFDAAILMTHATVVARALHPAMLEQRCIANREVFLFLQVSERRRQTVGTVFAWAAAGLPKRVLQSRRERLEALTTINHAGVFPVRERQHEVIQQVVERDSVFAYPFVSGSSASNMFRRRSYG